MTERPRVLVTGMGLVSPIGCGRRKFHEGQLSSRRGVRTITHYSTTDHPIRIAGEVDLPHELELDRRERAKSDRCTQLAAAAAQLAVTDSGIEVDTVDPSRFGIVMGCGLGGMNSMHESLKGLFERGVAGVRPRGIPMSMINDASGYLAVRYGFTGPCVTVATACASGADAVATGYQMIVSGEIDAALVGGTEAPVVPGVVVGFARLGALSARNYDPQGASRPFSVDRDGFVVAEAAAVLVLESAEHASRRGAEVHAELAGFGRSCDAHHVTTPHPEGAGAVSAMRTALRSARLNPTDVGHVNAHGTGTMLNDATEIAALHKVFAHHLARLPISATKSLIGHSLGAAGAVEAIATVQALNSGLVPPTANLDRLDPALGAVTISKNVMETKATAALSNSFGFGGHNVVLALRRY